MPALFRAAGFTLALFILGGLLLGSTSLHEDGLADPASGSAPPMAPAQRAYVDPQTGSLAAPPPAPAPPPQARPPEDWFREIPGTTPGGGVKLNLQGRWRHHVSILPPSSSPILTCQPALRPETASVPVHP